MQGYQWNLKGDSDSPLPFSVQSTSVVAADRPTPYVRRWAHIARINAAAHHSKQVHKTATRFRCKLTAAFLPWPPARSQRNLRGTSRYLRHTISSSLWMTKVIQMSTTQIREWGLRQYVYSIMLLDDRGGTLSRNVLQPTLPVSFTILLALLVAFTDPLSSLDCGLY